MDPSTPTETVEAVRQRHASELNQAQLRDARRVAVDRAAREGFDEFRARGGVDFRGLSDAERQEARLHFAASAAAASAWKIAERTDAGRVTRRVVAPGEPLNASEEVVGDLGEVRAEVLREHARRGTVRVASVGVDASGHLDLEAARNPAGVAVLPPRRPGEAPEAVLVQTPRDEETQAELLIEQAGKALESAGFTEEDRELVLSVIRRTGADPERLKYLGVAVSEVEGPDGNVTLWRRVVRWGPQEPFPRGMDPAGRRHFTLNCAELLKVAARRQYVCDRLGEQGPELLASEDPFRRALR